MEAIPQNEFDEKLKGWTEAIREAWTRLSRTQELSTQ